MEEISRYVAKNKDKMKILNVMICMEENDIVDFGEAEKLVQSLDQNEIETGV